MLADEGRLECNLYRGTYYDMAGKPRGADRPPQRETAKSREIKAQLHPFMLLLELGIRNRGGVGRLGTGHSRASRANWKVVVARKNREIARRESKDKNQISGSCVYASYGRHGEEQKFF